MSSKDKNLSPTAASSGQNSAQMPVVNLDKSLNNLKKEIEEIFCGRCNNITKLKYMELYNTVYRYCTDSDPKSAGAENELYYWIRQFLKSNLESSLKDERVDKDLLRFYSTKWEEFFFHSKVLDGIFAYYNRDWIKRAQVWKIEGVTGIYQLALCSWKDYFFSSVAKPLEEAVFKLINERRCGKLIDTKLLSSINHSYIELGVTASFDGGKICNLSLYRQWFETNYLRVTEDFFFFERQRFLKMKFRDYMKNVETTFLEEEKSTKSYVHSTTFNLVTKMERKVFIEDKLELYFSELQSLLQNYKREDICRMLWLLTRLPEAQREFCEKFEDHIICEGLSAVENCKETAVNDPETYISILINIYRSFSDIVAKDGQSANGYVEAIDKALKRVINDNAVTRIAGSSKKSAEMLALFCDKLLQKKSKDSGDTDIDDTLNYVIGVLRCIEDKDAFEKNYERLFISRLLNAKTCNDSREASLVNKLKKYCRYEYIFELEMLLRDVRVSTVLTDNFNALFILNEQEEYQFEVKVLRMGTWPFRHSPILLLPKELEIWAQRFTTFYSSQYSGRRIQWLHHISKGEVYVNCFQKKFILEASTSEIVVLLQYNSSDSFIVKELHERIQMPMDMLLEVLQNLMKLNLLCLDEGETELQSCSVVRLNLEYEYRKFKRHLNFALKFDTEAGKEKLPNIQKDRDFAIQAAIVRTLKMHKVLEQNELQMAVVNQISSYFVPQECDIKRCISILIDKDYIENLEKDKYKYKA